MRRPVYIKHGRASRAGTSLSDAQCSGTTNFKIPGKLIYNAYQEDIRNDSRGVKNWVKGVKIVLERWDCGLTHFLQNQTIPSNFNISKCVYNILKHKYENLFFNSINSDIGVTKTGGNKLRAYAKLKHEYKMENYLNLDLELHSKKAMAEIRVSAHSLEIERGRKKQAEINT